MANGPCASSNDSGRWRPIPANPGHEGAAWHDRAHAPGPSTSSPTGAGTRVSMLAAQFTTRTVPPVQTMPSQRRAAGGLVTKLAARDTGPGSRVLSDPGR